MKSRLDEITPPTTDCTVPVTAYLCYA